MAARAREHEIRMTEIYFRAMSVNTNEGNHSPPPPTNIHTKLYPCNIIQWQLQILQHLSQQHLFHLQFAIKCTALKAQYQIPTWEVMIRTMILILLTNMIKT